MALTAEQLPVLKAAILAETDPAFVVARQEGAVGIMADFYNTIASPAVKAWRTSVPPQDTDEATPWANFDSITIAAKRDSWLHAFPRFNRNYSQQPIRKWVTDVWGAASAGSNAAVILVDAGQRDITRGEAILGGTTLATTNTVSARKLVWEGFISANDVIQAINLP